MSFNRPNEQRWAEYCLLEAVLIFRKAGFTLWYLLKLAAKMWEHPHKESAKVLMHDER